MIAPGPNTFPPDDPAQDAAKREGRSRPDAKAAAAESDSETQAKEDTASEPGKPSMKRSQIVVGAIFGTVITFLIGVVVIIALNRDSLPLLTPDELETARYLWRNNEINSYAMTLELKGVQPGLIEIEVENGEPTRMVRDGRSPDRRTWDVWSVEGLFETIERDFANRENSEQTFGVASPEQVLMYAVFDKHGVPTHYRRMVQGRPYTVEWIVTEFKPRGR